MLWGGHPKEEFCRRGRRTSQATSTGQDQPDVGESRRGRSLESFLDSHNLQRESECGGRVERSESVERRRLLVIGFPPSSWNRPSYNSRDQMSRQLVEEETIFHRH